MTCGEARTAANAAAAAIPRKVLSVCGFMFVLPVIVSNS
jgi:hypothetical protein